MFHCFAGQGSKKGSSHLPSALATRSVCCRAGKACRSRFWWRSCRFWEQTSCPRAAQVVPASPGKPPGNQTSLRSACLRRATGCQVCVVHKILRVSLCLRELTLLIVCCPYHVSSASFCLGWVPLHPCQTGTGQKHSRRTVSRWLTPAPSSKQFGEESLPRQIFSIDLSHVPGLVRIRLDGKLPHPSRGAGWRGPPAVIAAVCVASTARPRWLVCTREGSQRLLTSSQGLPKIWSQALHRTASPSDAGLLS